MFNNSFLANDLRLKVFVIAIVLISTYLPISIAIHLANVHGQDFERSKLLAYANDVQRRTDETTDQILDGIEKLKTSNEGPCTPKSIKLMRDIDLGSSYIQAVGYMDGNKMICSSLGDNLASIDFGPVDFTSKRKAKIRKNISLSDNDKGKFLLVEKDNYAAIIHKDLPIDATALESNISLAVFMTGVNKVLTSQGPIKLDWINRLNDSETATFIEDKFLVTIVKSKKHLTASIAAIPTQYIDSSSKDFKKYLIPIGILLGITLSAIIISIAKMQFGIPTAIKTGLKKNQFYLEYQPVVELKTGKWIGAEALIRWKRHDGTIIRPDLFIPIAEEAKLIQSITNRVFELVEKDMKVIFSKNADFHIAINLAPEDVHSELILQKIQHLLNKLKIEPRNLIVEVTERGFMDPAKAKKVIEKIRESGVKVAIDDFGTGYSSLSYLSNYKIDLLKIDRSFVSTLGTDAPTSKVTTHIIEMGKSIGAELIAEGVETQQQAEILRGCHVNYAQGWLFAKPMKIEELEKNIIES